MIEFRKKTDLSGYVPYTGATAEVVLGQNLTLGDDKYLWFDTAKTQYLKYDTNYGTLRIGGGNFVGLYAEESFEISGNAATDGGGSWQPVLQMLSSGVTALTNTTQGNAGDKYFLVDMTDGIRLDTGGHRAIILADNIATSDKTFQFPNASGTIGAVITKTNTGDPTGVEGVFCINTFDNNFKVYADGAWRSLATW